MNPELPNNSREEIEQRLTALLLGELPAEESAALHRAMEQDGELAKLFARLHHTVGLVRETVKSSAGEAEAAPVAPLKLSLARREKLLAHFKTVAPKEFAPEKRQMWVRVWELAAVLVIVGLLAATFLPALSKTKYKSSMARREDVIELSAAVDENTPAPPPVAAPASANLAFQNSGPMNGPEHVGFEVHSGAAKAVELESANFYDGAAPTETFGLTPQPAKPATPIALPSVNQAVVVDGDADRSGGALYSQRTPQEGDGYYRFTTGSAGGGGGGAGGGGGGSFGGGGVAPSFGGSPISGKESQSKDAPVQNSLTLAGGVVVDGSDKADVGGTRLILPERRLNKNQSDYQQPVLALTGVDPVTGLELAKENTVTTTAEPRLEESLRTRGRQDGFVVNGTVTPTASSTLQDLSVLPRGKAAANFSRVADGNGGIANQPVLAGDALNRSGENRGSLALAAETAEGLGRVKGVNGSSAVQAPEVQLRAKFAEVAQNDQHALGVDWYLGDAKKLTETSVGGKSGSLVDRESGLKRDGALVAADLPADGRFYLDLPRGVNVQNSVAVTDGGKITPDAPVYSMDAVGYVDVAAKSETQPGSLSAPRSRRQSGLASATQPVSAAEPQKNLYAAQSDQKLAFVAKKRELQELTEFDQLLKRKMAAEKVDFSLPKSAQIEIVELADAKSAPATSWFGKVRGAISGEVERTARIKVENDKTDIAGLSGEGARGNAYDPNFSQLESEIIQSEAVLGKVVDELKLDEAWAKGSGTKLDKKDAVAMLRDRIEVRPVPNTTTWDVQAKSTKPEEAAKIANTVAAAYKNWRFERKQQLTMAGINELQKQSQQHAERMDRTKAELDQLREELKISDAEAAAELNVAAIRRPATNAPIPQPEILTSENNFSTFSLNVSDVSFKLAAASLEKGLMPDAASVRSEEFINAFDYRDPEPQAGAPIAFAWERAHSPFAHNRDLLRLSLKTAAAGRQAGRPLNVVLLLDNSGSMERADRVQIIREALRVMAAQLQPQDKLSVITFARMARLVADGISGDKAGEVAEQVGGLTPQGGTNLEDAMNLAYQTAARHYVANGINRVVLLTDGAANLGDVEPDSLKQKVETQRKQGIALDCFGIGWDGLNDDLLEVLSRNGDGRYGFINTPEEAATDFVGQLAGALKVAASDVKVQVEFNPKRVTSFRQIGYAKHQLTKEQFRDNTVDAAEIAAQEAGNALYTVEVNPAGQGPLGAVRVRYKVPGTTDYREQAWDVPYTGNVLSLEQASTALRLAASASAFAEWLVASPFAGEVTPDRLLGYLRGVPEIYGADARPKKLEWMIRQAKSLEGK